MVRSLFGKVRCCQGYRINGSCAPVNDGFAVVDCWVSLSCSGEGGFAGVGPCLWVGSTGEQSFHRSWLSIPRKKQHRGKFPDAVLCSCIIFYFPTLLLSYSIRINVLFDYLSFCQLLIPVSTFLRITFLCFKIHVE